MSSKGAEVAQQLREAKSSGQPLEAAIEKSGLKSEKLPAFSLIDEEKQKSDAKEQKNQPSELPAVKNAVALSKPGDISDFVPSGTDGFIAILEKREPLADANAGEKRAEFEKRILENKERIVLVEWLRDRQQAAGLEFKKG
jgi:hypothetical protein